MLLQCWCAYNKILLILILLLILIYYWHKLLWLDFILIPNWHSSVILVFSLMSCNLISNQSMKKADKHSHSEPCDVENADFSCWSHNDTWLVCKITWSWICRHDYYRSRLGIDEGLRLHIDHSRGLLALFQLSMHLTPGAPRAETCNGNVLAKGTLDIISVAHGSPHRQVCRRDKQRYPTGWQHNRTENVTQREAVVLSKSSWNRAGQARTAPEAIAASTCILKAIKDTAVPISQGSFCHWFSFRSR